MAHFEEFAAMGITLVVTGFIISWKEIKWVVIEIQKMLTLLVIGATFLSATTHVIELITVIVWFTFIAGILFVGMVLGSLREEFKSFWKK